MWTYLFWRFAFERAVKTFAQTLVALFSASGIGLLDAPWGNALSIAGMTALLSVLMSVGSAGVGEHDSPSLLRSGLGSEPAAAQPEPKPSVAV